MTEPPLVIMLADDNKNEYVFFKHALSKNPKPVKLIPLAGGIELTEYLFNTENPIPDILFLDVNMPLKNGKECLAAIRSDSRYADMPVVMHSTSDAKRDIDESYQLGADLYLIKSPELDDMKLLLAYVIDLYEKKKLKQPDRSSFTLNASLFH